MASREIWSGPTYADIQTRRRYIENLARMFPQASLLLSVRRQSDLIPSLYSEYLKDGGTRPFPSFFDPKGDTGMLRNKDFKFKAIIEHIERVFRSRPFVYTLHELESTAGFQNLLRDIAEFLGTPIPDDVPPLNQVENRGLGNRQLKILRTVNSVAAVHLSPDGTKRPYKRLRRFKLDPPNICQHWLGFLGQQPRLDLESKLRIDGLFADDWHWLQTFLSRTRTNYT